MIKQPDGKKPLAKIRRIGVLACLRFQYNKCGSCCQIISYEILQLPKLLFSQVLRTLMQQNSNNIAVLWVEDHHFVMFHLVHKKRAKFPSEDSALSNISFRFCIVVGRGGFEPPKASPAVLQTVPFGHLGTSPIFQVWKYNNILI